MSAHLAVACHDLLVDKLWFAGELCSDSGFQDAGTSPGKLDSADSVHSVVAVAVAVGSVGAAVVGSYPDRLKKCICDERSVDPSESLLARWILVASKTNFGDCGVRWRVELDVELTFAPSWPVRLAHHRWRALDKLQDREGH